MCLGKEFIAPREDEPPMWLDLEDFTAVADSTIGVYLTPAAAGFLFVGPV